MPNSGYHGYRRQSWLLLDIASAWKATLESYARLKGTLQSCLNASHGWNELFDGLLTGSAMHSKGNHVCIGNAEKGIFV